MTSLKVALDCISLYYHPFAIACNFPRRSSTIFTVTRQEKVKTFTKRHRVECKNMCLSRFSLGMNLGKEKDRKREIERAGQKEQRNCM